MEHFHPLLFKVYYILFFVSSEDSMIQTGSNVAWMWAWLDPVYRSCCWISDMVVKFLRSSCLAQSMFIPDLNLPLWWCFLNQIPVVRSVLFSCDQKYMSLFFGVILTHWFYVISSWSCGALMHILLIIISTLFSALD